jgi:uncharacterized membrane protein YgcG
VALLLGGQPASAVTSFYFDSFEADYYLSRDADGTSRLRTEEKLVAHFADSAMDNHGIERALPESYNFNDKPFWEAQNLELSIDGVTGGPYSTRWENDLRILRIGNANQTVRGVQNYGINWSASNVTRSFDSGDEFYWDANGNGWSQRFDVVTARVHIPADLVPSLDGRIKCWVGSYGASNENCDIQVSDELGGKAYTFASKTAVQPEQTLTFDIGFAAGTFAVPRPSEMQIFLTNVAAIGPVVAGGLAVILTVLALWMLVTVLKRYRPAKTGRAIIAQYTPPRDISVAEAATWFLPSYLARQLAFPATILGLAVNHYIEISEVKRKWFKNDYSIKLVKAPDDNLSADDRSVISTLFPGNLKVGQSVVLRERLQTSEASSWLMSFAGRVLARMRKADGFYGKPRSAAKLTLGIIAGSLLLAMVCVAVPFVGPSALLLLVPLAIAIVACTLYNPIGIKGAELTDYLRGLKEYMTIAEADRIKFLQSVKGAERVDTTDGRQMIKLYERLLPYAVIFGITNDWAKELQVYYDKNPDLAPVWMASVGSFSVSNFASSVNSFTSSSSAASSGSGFSGGGAGGGGGGGGGGGW